MREGGSDRTANEAGALFGFFQKAKVVTVRGKAHAHFVAQVRKGLTFLRTEHDFVRSQTSGRYNHLICGHGPLVETRRVVRVTLDILDLIAAIRQRPDYIDLAQWFYL